MGEVCAVDKLTVAEGIDTLDAVTQAVDQLAEKGVKPDVFRVEEGGRFDALTSCSASQLTTFDAHLDFLSGRLASLPAKQIVGVLKDLYQKAYRFDPTSGRMDVADPAAKNKLDLFIGAIDRMARQDRRFLRRIKTPAVEEVMALASADLSGEDRGLFHRLKNREITLKEAVEWIDRRDFENAASYNGADPAYDESPAVKSLVALEKLLRESVGSRTWQKARQRHLDEGALRKFVKDTGLEALHDELKSLPSLDLAQISIEAMMRHALLETNTEGQKEFVRVTTLIPALLTQRGLDTEQFLLRQMEVSLSRAPGMRPRLARFYLKYKTVRATPSRLDDYELRFQNPDLFDDLLEEEQAATRDDPI